MSDGDSGGDDDRWPGALPPEAGIGRVALRVGDVDATAAFYERVVGLDRLESDPERTVLGAGGRPLVELHAAPERTPRGEREAGLFHTAVRVPSRAALGACLERIDREATLDGASDHLVSEALYLRDPAGNGVEVYRDRPREEWPTDARGRPDMDTQPLDLESLRAASDGAAAAPDGTDVGHVHLEVTDLAASLDCWTDGVGLGLTARVRGAAFLAAGDYHHHVGLNTWNRRTEPHTGRGLAWVELVVPADALADCRRRLVAVEGIDVEEQASDAREPDLVVTDPDGIELRLRAAKPA